MAEELKHSEDYLDFRKDSKRIPLAFFISIVVYYIWITYSSKDIIIYEFVALMIFIYGFIRVFESVRKK